MRTPGRCTNFDSCWMANGRRDVRVLVGDPFVCPACGSKLQAPPMESISAQSMAGALAVSLVLVATAGGAGFAVVRLAQSAGTATVALLHPKPSPVAVAAAQVAPVQAKPEVTALGREDIADNPPRQYTSLQLAEAVPTLNIDASVPAAVYVAAAPPHPLVLPINFGRPQAPEDDAPAQGAHWHHRGLQPGGTYVVPSPASSPDDDDSMEQAQLGTAPAQGDGESGGEAGVLEGADGSVYVPPPGAASQDRAQMSIMPVQSVAMEAPAMAMEELARQESAQPPAALTRVVVPAVEQSPSDGDAGSDGVTVFTPAETAPGCRRMASHGLGE